MTIFSGDLRRPPCAHPTRQGGWVARLLAFFGLGGALLALLGAPATAGAQTFGDTVGLGVKFLQGQPLSDLDMLERLQVRWVREHVVWSRVEPRAGQYVGLDERLRTLLAYCRRHDIALVALLTLSNPQAYPERDDQPASSYPPEAFGRFAAEAVRLLKAQGVRFVIELGNEPHNTSLRRLLGGRWQGQPPSPWLNHYAAMVNAAVAAIKAEDPAVKVLANDDMWVVHHHLLAAGIDPRLDGLSVHPYSGTPEVAAVAHDTDWARPYQVVDPDRAFASAVRRLREASKARWGREAEIWVTEWGWATAGEPGSPASAVPERTVAAYLPRAFILAAEAGVQATCWFSSFDGPDGPMGLLRRDGSARAALESLRTLTAQLGPMRLRARLLGEQGVKAGVQLFEFTDESGHRTLVGWSAASKNEAPVLRWPAAGADTAWTEVDASGAAHPLVVQAQQVQWPLGPAPSYLRWPDGAPLPSSWLNPGS